VKRAAIPAITAIIVALGSVTAMPEAARAAEPTGLPAMDAPDTVRTNLWLVEALLGDVFQAAARNLPQPHARVQVLALADEPADQLARGVAARVLLGLGCEAYVTGPDSTVGPVDYVMAYRVQDVQLSYPTAQRTLGIWRRSVSRHVAVAVDVNLAEAGTGRVVYSDIVHRALDDLVDDSDFGLVESPVYEFTTAEVGESGWQRRAEEFVVLGTLAGLVAVYFANTGD